MASRQHGVVSRRQLLGSGVPSGVIDHRLSIHRLHRIHAGVYSVGFRLPTVHGRFMAAVLACNPDALLSHRSAAAMWDLQRVRSGPVDVTIPRGGSRSRKGIRVHTTRHLEPADVTSRVGIPCTSLARTFVDFAAHATREELESALEQSVRLRLFDDRAMQAAIGLARGRRQVAMLSKYLKELSDEPADFRSKFERRVLTLVRRERFPVPVVNGIVLGYEVDFHWPEQRLILEADGRDFHGTPQAVERDRERDLSLELAGWEVIRITWRLLTEHPHRVAARLRSRLR